MIDVLNNVADTIAEEKPRLLIFGGVMAMFVSGVWGCVNSYKKLPKAIQESNDEIEMIHKAREEVSEELYSKAEYKKDLTGAYGRRVLKIGSVIVGPLTGEIIGAALIFKGTDLLTQQVVAATAFAESCLIAYNKLKDGVDENFGPGTADKIVMGGKLEKPQNTEKQKWTYPNEPNGLYVFAFTQDNPEWVDDRALLYSKLSGFQNEFTDLMVGRYVTGDGGKTLKPGHIWLYEMLHVLSIDPEDDGKCDIANNTGNLFDLNNPIGDNFVDIGIDNPRNDIFWYEPGTRKFRRDPIDHNDVVWLEFNCDGLIGAKLNPNSRFQLELRTKGIATRDF